MLKTPAISTFGGSSNITTVGTISSKRHGRYFEHVLLRLVDTHSPNMQTQTFSGLLKNILANYNCI